MRSSPLLALAAGCVLLGGGCDPFKGFNEGDDALGPVDPVTFPPPNLGTGGDRKNPGLGRFVEITAFVAGQEVGYFAYPMPTLPAGADPLRVLDDGKPYPAVPTPPAYVFDGDDQHPFPTDDDYACNAPAGYAFDPRRDEVDHNQQGNVFSALPTATYAEGETPSTRYVPVVSEVRLSSQGLACQRIKSEKQVDALWKDAKPAPTGAHLAWLVIDPASPVFPRDVPMGVYPMGHPDAGKRHPGLGLQRWGWFNRYLVAYLDGGFIPTMDAMVPGATMDAPMRAVKRMRAQRLFVPRQIQMGMAMTAAPGVRGSGYDVLEARRGQPGYSPLCQVWQYGDPMMPPPAVAALPRNAADIMNTPALMAAPASPTTYVFCLQVNR